MSWKFLKFNELTNYELYEILRIRQEVFVVEQRINYVDADNIDQKCVHVFHIDDNGINAYARILPKEINPYGKVSFGRVLTTQKARRYGFGKKLIHETINYIKTNFANEDKIIISAQEYLEKFYSDFGFVTISEKYFEEGIEHIKMELLI